jgi:hypothetical protein
MPLLFRSGILYKNMAAVQTEPLPGIIETPPK